MLRYALILSACFLAGAWLEAGPAGATPICDGTTAQSFLNAVSVLTSTYDPQENGNNYDPPFNYASQFQQSNSAAITNDLMNAFTYAPSFFRQDLCNLDGIYVSPADCPNGNAYSCNVSGAMTQAGDAFEGAWGFRSRSPKDPGKKYISVSAALWPGGASARPLSEYESALLQSFMVWSGPTIQSATFNHNNVASSGMTILAALAHELGHVRWAEAVIPDGAGKAYKFDSLHKCDIGGTSIDFFQYWKYRNDQELRPPNRWREFNDASNDYGDKLDHSIAPFMYNLDDPNNWPSTSNNYLDQLYQSSEPWASLFGAQTPDEDFVETYVMAVLTGYNYQNNNFAGPLTNLPLTIPGYTDNPDVPRDLENNSKTTLIQKMRCVLQQPSRR